MTTEQKIQALKQNTVEVLTQDDLTNLFDTNPHPIGYIGVEPSGLFHVGWMIWVKKFKQLIDSGIEMTFLEATWHGKINEKLGGNIDSIRKCGQYFEQCLKALGVPMEKVHIESADNLMDKLDYWEIVINVASHMSLSRVKRAMSIMGRRQDESDVDLAKCMYPALQVADIYAMDLDVALGGLDQRRAHVLAREIAPKLGFKKPVAIHTPLLAGLTGKGRMDMSMEGELEEDIAAEIKMSKSKPETCIFLHDSPQDIERKIGNSFCPAKEIEYNPIIEIATRILFPELGTFHISRPEKFGGPIDFNSPQKLIETYKEGLHPADLKKGVSNGLIKLLEPVRNHFEKNKEANELYEYMKTITVTR
ncbi:MAG: tyrosine--tRNA ligase [Candidatus Hodarchaeota archaeon]